MTHALSLRRAFAGSALLLLAGLTACGKGDGDKRDALDKQLVAGAAGNGAEAAKAGDPALTGALADQILVDPKLAGKPNPKPQAATASRRGAARAQDEGALLHAPAPTAAAARAKPVGEGLTLGELARAQAHPAPKRGGCDKTFRMDAAWAQRLPDAVPLYADARVSEAAGNDSPGCRVRIVSYASAAPVGRLIDFYYSHAIRAGYSAEHQVSGAEHILGGARESDGSAYYITVAPRRGGGSAVDIVANHGR